jgi:nitroreductase
VKKIRILFLCVIFILPLAVIAGENEDNFVQVAWKKAGDRIKEMSMNETIKHIRSRRSVRVYKPEQVKDRDLNAILEAGLYAPSGRNKQPWHFTVIQNVELLDKLTALYKEEYDKSGVDLTKKLADDPNFRIFHGAPTGIIVSGDGKDEYAAAGCAAAVENMMIAAESLGLGTCWMQMNMVLFEGLKGAELAKELGVPDGYKVLYTFALGHPAEKPEAKERRENTVNIIK